jgi:hypothetical protein
VPSLGGRAGDGSGAPSPGVGASSAMSRVRVISTWLRKLAYVNRSGLQGCDASGLSETITSPRLRGEVGNRAQALPAMRGERASRDSDTPVRSSYSPVYATRY